MSRKGLHLWILAILILVSGILLDLGLKSSEFGPVVEVSYEPIDISCLKSGPKERVIRSDSAYKRLMKTRRDDADQISTCALPVIDFSKKTLLGNQVLGQCNMTHLEKHVFRSDVQRQYIYEITATFEGNCEVPSGESNWILVDKIPDDYSVRFEVNKTQL